MVSFVDAHRDRWPVLAMCQVIALPEGRADLDDLAEAIGLFADRLNLTPELLDDPAVVVRALPAGWRVESYTPDEAVVAVWNTEPYRV